jgi:hypothetical protein
MSFEKYCIHAYHVLDQSNNFSLHCLLFIGWDVTHTPTHPNNFKVQKVGENWKCLVKIVGHFLNEIGKKNCYACGKLS